MSDTESFDSVINESFKINKAKLQIAFEESLFGRLISDMRASHDREIRDVSQREYHRGYVDAMHARATATWQLDHERLKAARRLREFRPDEDRLWVRDFWEAVMGEKLPAFPAQSDSRLTCILRDRLIHLLGGDSNLSDSTNPINKDAETESFLMESVESHKLDERKAIVSKLERLQFDGDSHENLSKIAYAIYPCVTGWTCESATGLRDELIRLMGGTSGSQHVD